MSDSAPISTVTESAPTSTAETAANVIDAFEATETRDSGVEISSETPEPAAEPTATPSATADPAQTPAVIEKPLSEAEKLLHEAGYKSAKKPDGRDNYIPHSKVVKIIENGINQGKGEFGQRYQALETETKSLREYVEEIRADVLGDPKAFISKIAQVDPRYRAFLEPPAAPAQTAAPDAEMPAPDLPLPDGSRTYSLEGLQKLLEWNTARTEARLMPKFEERIKPWEEREQRERQHAQQQEAIQEIQTRTRGQMEEAQTWPMFGKLNPDGVTLTEFQAEVLGELRKDREAAERAGRRPTMTLRQAYLEAETRYKSADYHAVRERVLKELNGAPKGTAVARTGGDAPKLPAAASTSDIAARTLARLEKGA